LSQLNYLFSKAKVINYDWIAIIAIIICLLFSMLSRTLSQIVIAEFFLVYDKICYYEQGDWTDTTIDSLFYKIFHFSTTRFYIENELFLIYNIFVMNYIAEYLILFIIIFWWWLTKICLIPVSQLLSILSYSCCNPSKQVQYTWSHCISSSGKNVIISKYLSIFAEI